MDSRTYACFCGPELMPPSFGNNSSSFFPLWELPLAYAFGLTNLSITMAHAVPAHPQHAQTRCRLFTQARLGRSSGPEI